MSTLLCLLFQTSNQQHYMKYLPFTITFYAIISDTEPPISLLSYFIFSLISLALRHRSAELIGHLSIITTGKKHLTVIPIFFVFSRKCSAIQYMYAYVLFIVPRVKPWLQK